MPKQQQVDRLVRAVQEIDALGTETTDSQRFQSWKRATQNSLEAIFGPDQPHLADFLDISYTPASPTPPLIAAQFPELAKMTVNAAFSSGLSAARSILLTAIRDVNYQVPDTSVPAASGPTGSGPGLVSQPPAPGPVATASHPINTKDVFVVHGHDDGLKETVARMLSQIGLDPIILHEQADRGRTIIEKFDAHADVTFAVALFTPDDAGATAAQAGGGNLKPRARQNVVFELGYFVGRLGRDRTVALVSDNVELPSDWQGVLYIPVDRAGAWRFQLGKELRAAGLSVDFNKL